MNKAKLFIFILATGLLCIVSCRKDIVNQGDLFVSNTNKNVNSADAQLLISYTFTPASGYVPTATRTLGGTGNTVTFNNQPVSNYGITPVVGITYSIGIVSSNCRPSANRTFNNFGTGQDQGVVTIKTTGEVTYTVTLLDANSFFGVLLIGSYNIN